MKKKKNVALLYGGRGAEHEVSVRSAKFLYPLIDTDLFNIYPLYIAKNGDIYLMPPDTEWEKPSPAALSRGGILADGKFLPIHGAFPLLHGDLGEDGGIQGALLHLDIPFVGCEVHAGAVASDKAYTKLCAEALGIPTVDWIYSVDGSESFGKDISRRRAELYLGYPMFIKPARLGSSVGACAVHKDSDFDRAYAEAAAFDGRVIIEKLSPVISELECGYFGLKCKELFTKIGEIPSKGRFYSFKEKYSEESELSPICPSPLDKAYGDAIRAYSRALRDYLGIRHTARFDFFLTEDGRLLFNEINTMPGFTEGSLYPAMLDDGGITPREAVNALLSEVCGA